MDHPISEAARRQIDRARTRLSGDGLKVDDIGNDRWRVTARDGSYVFYFPIEDRWRNGTKWGRGVITLAAELKEGRGQRDG